MEGSAPVGLTLGGSVPSVTELPQDLLDELTAARATCSRVLGYRPVRPRDALSALQDFLPEDAEPDRYGDGGVVTELEEEIAALLGKPAALFFPSGTMAQQVVLRIWAERSGCRTIAYHPTAHVEIHEEHGYAHLHRLVARTVGQPRAPLTTADLAGVHEPLAALLLELPQREIGGPLPEWEELVAQTTWARDRGVAVHLDGARLWESLPYYGRTPAEVAGLFDTVYVSFYKGLGGIGGACLAGPDDVIREAAVWRSRHGGTLPGLWPLAASGLHGLRRNLPLMAGHLERAREIAEALRDLPGVEVVVDPPQTALMHLRLHTDAESLARAALSLAIERGWAVPFRSAPSESPRWRILELMVAEPAMEWPVAEVREAVQRLAGHT
jgi:threonine aldolase